MVNYLIRRLKAEGLIESAIFEAAIGLLFKKGKKWVIQ